MHRSAKLYHCPKCTTLPRVHLVTLSTGLVTLSTGLLGRRRVYECPSCRVRFSKAALDTERGQEQMRD